MSSKRKQNLEIESDGSPSHLYKYSQNETSNKHLELIEKEAVRTVWEERVSLKYYDISYNYIIMYYLNDLLNIYLNNLFFRFPQSTIKFILYSKQLNIFISFR